jgi:hypothetical protein
MSYYFDEDPGGRHEMTILQACLYLQIVMIIGELLDAWPFAGLSKAWVFAPTAFVACRVLWLQWRGRK